MSDVDKTAPEKIQMNWYPDYGDRVGLPINSDGNVWYTRSDLYEQLLEEVENLKGQLFDLDTEIRDLYEDMDMLREKDINR